MSKSDGTGKVGRLVVIGGAEDKKEGGAMDILSRFVELAGGDQARIIVCSSPSGEAEEAFEAYRKVFEELGVAEVIPAVIEERNEADVPELLEAVKRATGVFFTGGDQLKLVALIAGTHFSEGIRDRLFHDGMIVAGTSAGAAAMSGVMLIGGSDEGSVRRADVSLAPGLGLWRDTVVDTHFNQRGRVSRLMTVFAHNPQVLGIGIDENSAVEVELGERFTVLGENAVMVFNGHVTHSSAPKASDEDVLALTDALVHVLPRGYGFDLQTHRPILPNGERVETPTHPTSGGSRTAELGTGD
jgi:cyanophycinase